MCTMQGKQVCLNPSVRGTYSLIRQKMKAKIRAKAGLNPSVRGTYSLIINHKKQNYENY